MKQESLERFTEEEIQGSYKLPESWKWVRLGEVLIKKPQYGLTAKAEKEQREIRYIRISDITDFGELKDNDACFLDLEDKEFEKYRLENDDILIARSGSVGRVYLHKDIPQKSVFASYLIRFKLNQSQILPKFFYYYGLSPIYKGYIEKTLRIVAQPNINAKKYSNLPIPLPPLEEQKRIVARIEQLFSKIDKVKKLRKEALEEASALLSSALHQVFSKADEKGWKWVRLGEKEIAEIIMGQSPPSNTYNQEGVGLPFYQGKADFGELYPTPRIWCTKPNKIAEAGDILISVRAPVGPVNMCRERSCIGRGLAAIAPQKEIFDNFFLFYYFKSIEENWVGKGSTFGAIKKKDLQNLLIPLPPLEEQKRIVAYLDKIQEKALALQKLQEETEKEIEKLREAILHKAFTGGL
jgi:type I restriction enzyme S subunit